MGCVGNCMAWRKPPTAGFMTHVTCRLTVTNRDQLRNPTFGNRVWVTFLLDCIAYYRCSVVCVCVCLLVTTVSPTKTAEPIEVPFGM